MDKVFLVEDHDEALRVWREKKIKAVDLVHLDAHIDFGFYEAEPIEEVFKKARNLRELKGNLEKSLAFSYYQKDFNKQSNIGNYIYPAMHENIVKDFYWVIPGGLKEFKISLKNIKMILKNFAQSSGYRIEPTAYRLEDGLISVNLFGRRFIICILEKLPILKQKVLLDIDTDFLVIDSLLKADNTQNIGKRRPWIYPGELVHILKERVRDYRIITIAYSVNGGYTPMSYKYLGDETAFLFAPENFRGALESNLKAAKYFNLFCSTNKKIYYQKAARLNPVYRAQDNNYGPLYLSLGKLSFAKKEFLRILRVDYKNPACLWGLGSIALERKDFKKAKKYFSSVLVLKNHRLFSKVKNQSLLGLAKAEFNFKNFLKAKALLGRYQILEPLQPQSYYLLGCIFEKEKEFRRAAMYYKDAIRLGFASPEPLLRLLKISRYLEEKNDDIIKYIVIKYQRIKREFIRAKRMSLNKREKTKGLYRAEEKILSLERRLKKIKQGKEA